MNNTDQQPHIVICNNCKKRLQNLLKTIKKENPLLIKKLQLLPIKTETNFDSTMDNDIQPFLVFRCRDIYYGLFNKKIYIVTIKLSQMLLIKLFIYQPRPFPKVSIFLMLNRPLLSLLLKTIYQPLFHLPNINWLQPLKIMLIFVTQMFFIQKLKMNIIVSYKNY
ncbi:hypothetical protein [Spiroplasma eriocheiris]|uniref:hypothetical protein n=1 Tax=Spiroplasma eriocheiris TaxID=315358 RepID=UPI0009A4E009|nr:hypothetical protein [Spiroplasma eriocheiris]AHF57707.1 hypothetical protein SPE_0579 [Spiroplasma eriocheiris CCTCC M 207170]